MGDWRERDDEEQDAPTAMWDSVLASATDFVADHPDRDGEMRKRVTLRKKDHAQAWSLLGHDLADQMFTPEVKLTLELMLGEEFVDEKDGFPAYVSLPEQLAVHFCLQQLYEQIQAQQELADLLIKETDMTSEEAQELAEKMKTRKGMGEILKAAIDRFVEENEETDKETGETREGS